jgi:signal transduction histidine kinase
MLKNYDDDQITGLAHAGSLFQGTAHNINTPLTSILGRAEIVRLRLDRVIQSITDQELLQDLDKCRKDIGLIVENCTKVSSYVNNAAHRCSASIQSTIKPVNIACVLRDDLEFLLSDMEFKHNIEKQYTLDTDVPAINGAPVHFSNSFYEILDNARNAMIETASKKISVSVKADNGFIVVAIGDNGCGMDEQTRLGILRVLEQPPPNNGNSMSGLAYTAMLLQSYNPVFSIESRPGHTKVSVSFPVL